MKRITVILIIILATGSFQNANAQVKKAQTAKKYTPTAALKKRTVAKRKPLTPQDVANYKFPYQIEGTFDSLKDGEFVYLGQITPNGLNNYDSTKIVNGKFLFKGTCGLIPSLRFLTASKRETFTFADFFLEPGKISAQMTLGIPAEHIKGTALNNIYAQYKDTANPMNMQIARQEAILKRRNTTEGQKEAKTKLDSLTNIYLNYTYGFANKNMDNMIGLFLLDCNYQRLSVGQCDTLLAKIKSPMSELSAVKAIRNYVAVEKKTQIGQTIPDFTVNTKDDEPFTLYNYLKAHKYTLLHFWNKNVTPSWAMVPYILTCYQKYEKDHLGAVSFYTNTIASIWKTTSSKFQMIWPQVSDLKGFDSPILKDLGIQNVPFTLLVDSNGKIVERQIDGSDLQKVLEKYFQ